MTAPKRKRQTAEDRRTRAYFRKHPERMAELTKCLLEHQDLLGLLLYVQQYPEADLVEVRELAERLYVELTSPKKPKIRLIRGGRSCE